ncbi:DUF1715-domain-containing protein [Cryphonectria parasitica EP155]|uniref:DUF1715-domain-containing protein n=1 Tax=Cryphonectria parasitica (strain ATCC 38755 / EP155) TaxID=660469 RepID=A0A9P4XSZ9_CRYP1|nr:DUF1715-domain-containing protein [Cryphonectria parasitica EP155]KAF3760657.1 DUF1715-domain-containing protein [Cryphonectria parasitica EP155]
MASSDPFDDVLNLEDRFYSEGYEQGVADGARVGRIEGRSFGIEKGFEKFVEAGRLYSRSVVWANRLPQSQARLQVSEASDVAAAASTVPAEASSTAGRTLPKLDKGGSRLEKNIVTLHALVEPDTLSTENTDEAVNDFDDRVKRAQGKARVIERNVGEDGGADTAKADGSSPSTTAAKVGDRGEPSGSSTSPPQGPGIQF